MPSRDPATITNALGKKSSMRIERANPTVVKGWYLGPWSSGLPISLGYAFGGINEPHIRGRSVKLRRGGS